MGRLPLTQEKWVGYQVEWLHHLHFIWKIMTPDDIAQFFKILKKCQSKFDCLIFEMFFYQRTETNSKQTMRFHPRKIICLGRF